MIQQITTILKAKLATVDNGELPPGLLFVEKLAGLVQVGEKVNATDIEGAFAVTKFPISLDSDYEECFNSGCYKDLVPNSKLKGILYFEDFGTTPKGFQKGKFNYQSSIRLVCWVNNKLIQGNNCKSISHIFITQIRNVLENQTFNSGDFATIRVNCSNVIQNDYKLFSRYTYPNEIIKYLMHPYEAFGLELVVDYAISSQCLSDLVLNPELC